MLTDEVFRSGSDACSMTCAMDQRSGPGFEVPLGIPRALGSIRGRLSSGAFEIHACARSFSAWVTSCAPDGSCRARACQYSDGCCCPQLLDHVLARFRFLIGKGRRKTLGGLSVSPPGRPGLRGHARGENLRVTSNVPAISCRVQCFRPGQKALAKNDLLGRPSVTRVGVCRRSDYHSCPAACKRRAGKGGCLNRNVRSARNRRWRMNLVCCTWPSISHKGDPQMKVWMAVAGVLLVPA